MQFAIESTKTDGTFVYRFVDADDQKSGRFAIQQADRFSRKPGITDSRSVKIDREMMDFIREMPRPITRSPLI